LAENIDDLTVDYSEDDKLLVKQIDKQVLSRGSWTTILFLFQEMDKNTGEYGPKKATIRRYQKRNGVFRQQSKFNFSSAKQARQIIEALGQWFGENQLDETPAEEGSDLDS
jgi:hypothetical protein